MQRHTLTEIEIHSSSTTLVRSVKTLLVGAWGRGGRGRGVVTGDLNRFYVATTLSLSSAVVHTMLSFFSMFNKT